MPKTTNNKNPNKTSQTISFIKINKKFIFNMFIILIFIITCKLVKKRKNNKVFIN